MHAVWNLLRILMITLIRSTSSYTVVVAIADLLIKVARRAAYEATGESTAAIAKHIKEHPDVDGIVVGDETRLRQIITNLAR